MDDDDDDVVTELGDQSPMLIRGCAVLALVLLPAAAQTNGQASQSSSERGLSFAFFDGPRRFQRDRVMWCELL